MNPIAPTGMADSDQARIRLAESCRDCDAIPKADGAGTIVSSPKGDYQLMHNGLKIYCDSHYGPYNVEVIRRLRGHHEPQEEWFFHQVLKTIPSGGTILELGSCWGYYSLWFLSAVQDGTVYQVEPHENGLEAGKRNFALNGSQATFIHAAIGDRNTGEEPVELWSGTTVQIEQRTVDRIFEDNGLDRIDILHSDIQGAEVKMLRGAGSVLEQRRVNWWFVSTHSENIHQACLRIFRSAGYLVAEEHTPAESFSVDGLIVASRDSFDHIPRVSKRRTCRNFLAKIKAKIRVGVLEPVGLKPPTI